MSRRLLYVVVVLLVGLGSVFLLPKATISSPAGIALTLPPFVGGWFGEDAEVTPKEIAGLGPETSFARKLYTSGAGDRIYVSIVLSGSDMATSIHRPERCLPAQGWTIVGSDRQRLRLKHGEELEATRLRNVRVITAAHDAKLYNLNYYWFIGYHHSTASHLERTLLDMRDRLLHGLDQRWAYITVTSTVSDNFYRPFRTEADTQALIEAFVPDLVESLRTPDGKLIALHD